MPKKVKPVVIPPGSKLDIPGILGATELLEIYNNVMAGITLHTPEQRYNLWAEVSTRLHRLEVLESKRRIITKDFNPDRSN